MEIIKKYLIDISRKNFKSKVYNPDKLGLLFMSNRKKIIIMGAAGRDFHNFNVYFRDNKDYEVVAFTATQIPDISDRLYPKELSGNLYPNGIPIYPETELTDLIKKNDIDEVIFAYSDLPYPYVMKKSAIVNAAGADFCLLGPKNTMIKSKILPPLPQPKHFQICLSGETIKEGVFSLWKGQQAL